jgi:hypothetical protein
MKHNYFFNSIKLAFAVGLMSASIAVGQAPAAKVPVVFTEKDREFALKYLGETKADFVKELTGVSDAQLNFRAGPTRWTIAEIAEHIIVTENALFGLITGQIMKAPAPEGKDNFRARDTGVVLAITNRSQKFTAPEIVRPNGRWKTRDELLTNFEKTRNQTIDFMRGNKDDLRGHFMENPLMGVIDGYQWFLFAIGHSERHLAQLKEVKADASYPKK